MENGDTGLSNRCSAKYHRTNKSLRGENIKEHCPDRANHKSSESQMGTFFLWLIIYVSFWSIHHGFGSGINEFFGLKLIFLMEISFKKRL